MYRQALTRTLADAQERHALNRAKAMLFTLYTENRPNLAALVSRYFQGATIYNGVGLWQGETEHSAVVEIVGTMDDLQRVVFLAGDIREVNKQQSVLLTYGPVSSILVGDPQREEE